MNSRHTEVVIVGAGLAGLAARTLTAASIDTLVLEARNRVGEHNYTVLAQDGTRLDLGGQWIGPSQHTCSYYATKRERCTGCM